MGLKDTVNNEEMMTKDFYRLEDIIDIDKFQKIQDDIAKATDMAILTVDYKGVPFTGHSHCQKHCSLIREIAHYSDLCMKCDSRGGLEAARLHKPYIYLCHRGLVDLAVPIVVNGQYVGAVMAGQVQIEQDEQDNLETIVNGSNKWLLKASEQEKDLDHYLSDLRKELPMMRLSKIEAIASMLFHISRYIVEEAMLKAKLTSCVNVPIEPSPNTGVIPSQKADIIQPALDYIESHAAEKVYIEHMASLCSVSVSYFSKCFNSVVGQNFATYHNQIRLKKACALLETTHDSVNAIADHLGFDTPGYFIKKFKATYGITPSIYRQQYRAKRLIDQSL